MKPNHTKFGERRTIIKFAWFPMQVGNYIVWLEWYKSIESNYGRYDHRAYWVEIGREIIDKEDPIR